MAGPAQRVNFYFFPFSPEIFTELSPEHQMMIQPYFENPELQCELVVTSVYQRSVGVLIYERTHLFSPAPPNYVQIRGLVDFERKHSVPLFREMVKRVEAVAQSMEIEQIRVVFSPEQEREFRRYLEHLPLKLKKEGVYSKRVALPPWSRKRLEQA